MVRRYTKVKDRMAEENSDFGEAEKLNEKLADASDALEVFHKKVMEVLQNKAEDKSRIIPFEKREK